LLAVTGSNAGSFLNGILSNKLPTHGGIFSSLLHAQGRVLYDLFVYPYNSPDGQERGYLVEYDPRPSQAIPLLSLLKRYILRSRVKIRDAALEWDVWAGWGDQYTGAQGPERCWHWAASQVIEPKWIGSKSPWAGSSDLQLFDRRIDGMGIREVVRQGDKPSFAADRDEAGAEQYLFHRIMHGVPEGSEEIVPTQALPMECNLDLMGAIDFRKGCYVGQELTVRTYHTGLVRKRVMPVQIFHAKQSSPDAFVLRKIGDTAPAGSDIKPVALDGNTVLRLRGHGTLLNSLRGLGLAVLRGEQVEAADNGQITLQMKNQSAPETPWQVEYWWPEAWPAKPPLK